MKSKRLFIVFVALGLAALACSVNFSSAKIKDAWTARNEAGDQRTTTFEQKETFYVKVEMGNAPDDTKVKTAFSSLEVDGDDDNKLIGEKELAAGSGTLTFSASPATFWPAGKYKAEIFLNGTLDRTLNFEVKGSQTAQTSATVPAPPTSPPAVTLPPTQGAASSPAQITQAFHARDENGTQPATTFAPTDVVYTIFVVNAPQGAQLKARWLAKETRDMAANTVLDELPFEMTSSGQNWVRYTPDQNNPLSPGTYTVELYVSGKLSHALDFTVQEEPAVSDAPSITGAYMAFDEDGNSPTTVYGDTDTFYCIVSFDAPFDAAIRLEWYAEDVLDGQNGFIDSYEDTYSGVGTTWFSLSPNGAFSVGTYRVDIYIAGEYSTTLYFEVQ